MCKHLRHKSFTTEDSERGGMNILIDSQMMADEVNCLISHHESIESAMKAKLLGYPFAGSINGEIPKSIYQYCLYYFREVECPLGSSTEMLIQWVGNYIERVQNLYDAFERIYGEVGMLTVPDEQGNPYQYLVSDAEKFNSNSANYLRLIEQSHVLSEYNERMLRVHTMLLAEEPLDCIMKVMQLG